MKRQTYYELLQSYKNNALEKNKDTFDFEGEKIPYPDFILGEIIDNPKETRRIKYEYRKEVISKLTDKRTEEELINLPCKEKLRRYAKNTGLEVLASTIESATVFLWIGGIHMTCDGLREKKEMTYRKYQLQKSQNITDMIYRTT